MKANENKRKMLYVSAHCPKKNAVYAGHKTAYKILQDFSRDFDIDLVLICGSSEREDIAALINEGWNVIHVEIRGGAAKLWAVLLRGLSLPLKVATRFSSRLTDVVNKNIGDYDRVHFEFTHAAASYNLIKIPSSTTVSVSSHDVLTQGGLRSASSVFWSWDVIKTFNFERQLYDRCDIVMLHNEKDKLLVSTLFSVPLSKLLVINPPLCDFVYDVGLRRKCIGKGKVNKKLIFWGAMNRKENEEALVKFWEACSDSIKKNDFVLYVVGANPSKLVKGMGSENLVVTGYVENPSEYFLNADFGISPLINGAGIKVKTLEMLESGLPVISTPVGAEGVSHPELMVVEFNKFSSFVDDYINGIVIKESVC